MAKFGSNLNQRRGFSLKLRLFTEQNFPQEHVFRYKPGKWYWEVWYGIGLSFRSPIIHKRNEIQLAFYSGLSHVNDVCLRAIVCIAQKHSISLSLLNLVNRRSKRFFNTKSGYTHAIRPLLTPILFLPHKRDLRVCASFIRSQQNVQRFSLQCFRSMPRSHRRVVLGW